MPTDPRGLRGDAPLLDAWLRFQERPPAPFTIPGHKQRGDLVGDVVAGDVPLYAGLDTMKLANVVLAAAEARAARLWGADFCRFSTGGATHANQAVALALAGDGDRVIVSLPVNSLIAELGQGGGTKKDGLLFALGGALRAFPNEIMVQGRGVAAGDTERWGKLFVLTQLSAAAIEQAGVAGPIPARTELAPGDATAMQVNVIITARAADTAD